LLHLYQSNRLETLAELLHGVLAVPPADPYARETVIVQARGMGRWLSLQIAERFGVCANVEFPLPASFLWSLTEAVLGPQARRGPFGVDALAWRLYAELAAPPDALAPYLHQQDDRRRWRLAQRLADLFDSYLVYRHDWLAAWEKSRLLGLGDDEAWQANLWQRLAQGRNSPHRADLMQQLLDRLQQPAPLDLPERVVAFGISSLPPLLLEVMRALARRTEVCLFVLNPCAEAWRDVDRKADTDTPGERLIAALGGQGRDFLDQVSAEAELHSLFDFDAPPTLLGAVQHNVLTLGEPEPGQYADGSIQIHACHSPLRQVETLRDALLAAFDADPTLEPDQVVVLCPDIETYAPHVEAVFGQGDPYIPFAVADRGALATTPLLATFLALLYLPDTDWEADQVAALLEAPALAEALGLTEDDLPLIRDWISAAGIRHGRAGHPHAWSAGMGRLLLAAAMPTTGQDDAAQVFAGLCPVEDIDLRFAPRIAALARFVRMLGEWQDELAHPCSLADWSLRLMRWSARWFGEEEVASPARQQLNAALASLQEIAVRSAVNQAVARIAIAEWLKAALSPASGAGGFLTGGVTFAQLVPMRNLPFRVVGVLGLDDGSFPRERQPDGFDLIARHPRPGDRSRRQDDRWLFLETLLAARDQLLLCFNGRDQRTDVSLPPSTVIADLLDAAHTGWPVITAASLITQHPLQPFSPRRFASDATPPGFDRRWAEIAAQAGQGVAAHPALTHLQLATPMTEKVELADILRFARDPSRWHLRQLGVGLDRHEEELAAREPFAMDRAGARRLLARTGDRADDASWVDAIGQATALLPTGRVGRIWAGHAATGFAPAVAAWRNLTDTQLSIALQFGEHRLLVNLNGIDTDGLGLRCAAPVRDADRAIAWLQHLALCVAQPDNVAPATRLIGLDAIYSYSAPPDARACLQDWLDLYRIAHTQLTAWLPRSAFAFAEAAYKAQGDADKDTTSQGLGKALPAWQGSEHGTGEGAFDSVRTLWRGESPLDADHVEDFCAIASQLLFPLLAHETRTPL